MVCIYFGSRNHRLIETQTVAPEILQQSAINTMAWKKVSSEEARLAKMWIKKDGKIVLDTARLLHRTPASVYRLVKNKFKLKKQGRDNTLTKAQVNQLIVKLKGYIKAARGKRMITVALLRKWTRTKACSRVILDALHARGIYFRPLREKPLLTDGDVKDRFQYGKDNKDRTPAWWLKIHAHIDCKWFKVYLHGKARSKAAQDGIRGAYRGLGDGLKDPYVKFSSTLKYNTGARGVMVLAAMAPSGVILWEYVKAPRWNGAVAAQMYKGALLTALKKTYPGRSQLKILEDNDPAGFKSSKGMQAKKESRIKTFDIPKRSPQLNVCDYALWSEVNKRMRRQERLWPESKKETRAAYLTRLRRTALRLPGSFCEKSIKDMRRRSRLLFKAKGKHFEEGGRT